MSSASKKWVFVRSSADYHCCEFCKKQLRGDVPCKAKDCMKKARKAKFVENGTAVAVILMAAILTPVLLVLKGLEVVGKFLLGSVVGCLVLPIVILGSLLG